MKHNTRPLTQTECRALSTKYMKIHSGYQIVDVDKWRTRLSTKRHKPVSL